MFRLIFVIPILEKLLLKINKSKEMAATFPVDTPPLI